ncbi:PadR family transcriptional regulator [Saccharothrix violaceirubra]|uniref:DNA-binding PadR family transcriptional regulator n=1 Tax=Saccharothrix violaceirubra TaxID=413306 RepID=A0A7W7T4L2_9PSEU|nr:PadR family transcriptional regulator [Saccharothrix violaceirubra]MBB4965937.1 DNA-binding PadR family transcriptional regulator [Saccharothrix violaceirubra]
MARPFRRANTLALAVLGLLRERDMHPYEMAATLRERHQVGSVKLSYGTLYTVVDSLRGHGLVEAVGAGRAGNRPERTTYRLTGAGRAELHDWLRELVAVPVKEYPRFEAGIALVGLVPPEEAVELAGRRVAALDAQVAALEEVKVSLAGVGLPQLAWIELEYRSAMLRAERDWVSWFAGAAREGSLGGMDFWRDVHSGAASGDLRDAPPA